MGRPRTGSTEWMRNAKTGAEHWHVRFTLADGTKSKWRPLDPSIPREDRAAAKEAGAIAAQRGATMVDASKPETVEEYSMRWLASREGRLFSVNDTRGHLRKHILPVIGTKAMPDVTREDIERVVAKLDEKVRQKEKTGRLVAKSAKNIWGTCTKMFDDATNAKPATGLRCLATDPTDKVRGPDNGPERALQFLYPSEFLSFVTCKEVPLAWRRALAIDVYMGARIGELIGLQWSAVDLALLSHFLFPSARVGA